jgi:hypothetical protein
MLLLLQALVGSAVLLTVVTFNWASDTGSYRPSVDRSDFYPAPLRPAGQWLGQRVDVDEVVLAQPRTGNYLVQAIRGRVYVGHWSATVEYLTKRGQVDWLYAEPIDEARLDFLVEHRVRYVVAGPIERVSERWVQSAAETPGLSLVYQSEGVSIFEVARP